MFNSVFTFALFLLVAVCTANHVTNVKEIHAIADGPAIDIYIDGVKTRSGISYGSVSDYIPVPRGNVFVQITRTGVSPATETLISQGIELIGGQYVTIAAVGSMTNPDFPLKLFMIEDEIIIPPEQALLRTLYLSPTDQNIDVLNEVQTFWRNISYPGAGTPEYLLLTPNIPYELEVRASVGSSINLAGPTLINMPRNSANTIFVIGMVGSRSSPLTIIYSKDFVTGQITASPTSTRTPSTTISRSQTPSSSQTATVTRSINTSPSTTPTPTTSRTRSVITTRTAFRSVPQDDDDGDFTKSTTPIPASPFLTRSAFRTIAQPASATSTPGPLATEPFPSPFLSRTPFQTTGQFPLSSSLLESYLNELLSSSSGSILAPLMLLMGAFVLVLA